MTTYTEMKRALAERDRMLRDAYHGRNGYSMSEAERANYRAMMERTKAARKVMR